MPSQVKPDSSLGAAYFDRLYASRRDPWNFATSRYENQKYRATIEAIADRRYARALEIGCSIGVLTKKLAGLANELVSVDVSETALQSARRRCKKLENVSFARMAVPHEFPGGSFDLVVVSEVGYYWSSSDLSLAIDRIADSARGGIVELVHYLPKVEDYPHTGDEVHDAFLADARFQRLAGSRTERYRIDVLNA